MQEQMFGFLNVYKPKDMTSHDVVDVLRKVTKIKQIGHTGTLDPFAQGVLPICIGKATRLIEYLDDEKEYIAEISFGKNTDTYDLDGKIVSECDLKITQNDVEKELESFKGEILQTPPIYSALKVKGKKLYEYARNGEEVKIEPRTVFIEKIELKDFDEVNQKAEVLIKCSKGTYIRSIAHDLGQNLKVGAYLSKLIRTQAGKFFIDATIALEEIKTVEDVQKNLINPPKMLNFPQVEITEEEHKKIIMGQFIDTELQSKQDSHVMLNLFQHRMGKRLCDPETSSGRRVLIATQYDNKNHLQKDNFLILIYNNNVSAIGVVSNNQIKAKKVFL